MCIMLYMEPDSLQKAITHEQFEFYQALRNSIITNKGKRSDLFDVIHSAKKQLAALEEQLNSIQGEIDEKSEEFNRFLEFLAQEYQLQAGVYNFAETEPHYISYVNQ